MATLAPVGSPGLMGYLRSKVELPDIPTFMWEPVNFHIYQPEGQLLTTARPVTYAQAASYIHMSRRTMRPATRWRRGVYRIRWRRQHDWFLAPNGEPIEFRHLSLAMERARLLVGQDIEIVRKVARQ